MPIPNIITGQKISAEKLQRAKELRQQMTEAEKLLWNWLRSNRLDGLHFRRQQVIAGFIVDYYCHAAGLVVEVDGVVHDHRVEHDLERERVLQELGLRVLRVKNEMVMATIDGVLEQIRRACEE